MFLVALDRSTAYRVGDKWFPVVNISAAELRAALEDNGFERSSIEVEAVSLPEHRPLGYDGILLATGITTAR
jgi:hypothetical protein